MFKKKIVSISVALCFIGTSLTQNKTEDLTQYVDPLIETQDMGHVFPEACVPFGRVQLSLDRDTIGEELIFKIGRRPYIK